MPSQKHSSAQQTLCDTHLIPVGLLRMPVAPYAVPVAQRHSCIWPLLAIPPSNSPCNAHATVGSHRLNANRSGSMTESKKKKAAGALQDRMCCKSNSWCYIVNAYSAISSQTLQWYCQVDLCALLCSWKTCRGSGTCTNADEVLCHKTCMIPGKGCI